MRRRRSRCCAAGVDASAIPSSSRHASTCAARPQQRRKHSASAASSSHERAASRRGASADAAAGAGAGAGAGAPAPVHSQSAAAKAGAAQKSFSPRGVAHTDASVDGASGTHRRQRTHRWTGLTSDGHGRSIGGTTAYDQPSAVTALGSSRQPSAAKPSCTDLPPLQQERWHQRAGSVGYRWPGKVEPQPTKGSHRWSSHTSPSSRIHGASGASASSVRTRLPTASATRASSARAAAGSEGARSESASSSVPSRSIVYVMRTPPIRASWKAGMALGLCAHAAMHADEVVTRVAHSCEGCDGAQL